MLDEAGNVITPKQRLAQYKERGLIKEGQTVAEALGRKDEGSNWLLNQSRKSAGYDPLKNNGNKGITFNDKVKTNIQKTRDEVNKQNTQQITQKAQQRKITQSAPVKDATNKAFQAGQKQGQNSVGLMGGIKNTWNNSGTLGKAGMVAAGVGTAALAAKGIASMFGGRKRKRRKYEDDY